MTRTEEISAFGSWNIIDQEAPPRALAANVPLLLNDSQIAWLITTGEVDVFAVPLANGEPAGARLHCFRARVGQLLLGAEAPAAAGSGLIAVGLPGTEVREIRVDRLQQLASERETAVEWDARISGWIDSLTRAAAGRLPPRLSQTVASETSLHFAGVELVAPSAGTVWVQHTTGTSRFLGREDFSLTADGELFPLSATGWLQIQSEADLNICSTMVVASANAIATGLARFHRHVLQCLTERAAAALAEEGKRLERKASAERERLQQTLRHLAAVSETAGGDSAPEPGEPPLVTACRLVGASAGIAVRAPAPGAKAASDPVGAVARANRFRTRRVVLRDGWWTQDSGPLLAFRAETQPVALIPAGPHMYDLIDPTTGSRTPVLPAIAAELQPFAWTFYRPFAARALGGWDLLRFGLFGCRRDLLIVGLLGLAGGVLGMLPAIALGLVFDRILPAGDRGQLGTVVLALSVAAIAAAVFRLVQGLAMLRVETRGEQSLEAGVWDRLLNLPVSFFRTYAAGDLTLRAMGLATIRRVLTEAGWSSLVSLLFSIVSFAVLFAYAPGLGLLALGLVAALVGVTCAASWRQLKFERGLHGLRGRTAGLVLQLITGISRLRVAGAEDRALAVWADQFGQQRRLAFRATSVANSLAAFSAAAPTLALVVLYAVVAGFSREQLSLGAFLGFNAAFVQILLAADSLSTAASSTLQVVPLLERARPILDGIPEIDARTVDPGELSGEIEVNHVSFRYQADSPPVLRDISVRIGPGEFVAFVGPSGAGKSSLLRLLLGFESPNSGSIYYDRQDLAGLNCQAVRRQIGVVLQSGKLMPGDIFSNIVGTSPLALEDAWEAARLSGLDAEIAAMPMGMFTAITEGECILSGGQKQRLMIARAIANRPRMLFFDEATSALDNATQAIVRESLSRLQATRVVIAHRLSTVMYADRIYVMEAGRIVQQGRYDELLNQPGLFADLVKRQLA